MEQEIRFYKGICEEQTKKIEELKKENETIRGGYYKESEWDGEFKKMTKDEMIGFCEIREQQYNFIKKQLDDLKKENEKWMGWASKVIYFSHTASKDNLVGKKLLTDDLKPVID